MKSEEVNKVNGQEGENAPDPVFEASDRRVNNADIGNQIMCLLDSKDAALIVALRLGYIPCRKPDGSIDEKALEGIIRDKIGNIGNRIKRLKTLGALVNDGGKIIPNTILSSTIERKIRFPRD